MHRTPSDPGRSSNKQQQLASADTNTGHGNDAADTELDREVRGEIESLVLQKQEMETEKRELASESMMAKLGSALEVEACRRLFNRERRGRCKDAYDDEDDDVEVPIVVHAHSHSIRVPVTHVYAGGRC